MKTKTIGSFFVLFAIVAGVGATIPAAFADHTEVTIATGVGSGSDVECGTDCYTPSTVTVDVGGVVIFSNPDAAPHTFTAGTIEGFGPGVPSGEFDTSILLAGNSSKWTPDTAGEVPYYCTLHSWMTGMIIVQDNDMMDDMKDDMMDDMKDDMMDDMKDDMMDDMKDDMMDDMKDDMMDDMKDDMMDDMKDDMMDDMKDDMMDDMKDDMMDDMKDDMMDDMKDDMMDDMKDDMMDDMKDDMMDDMKDDMMDDMKDDMMDDMKDDMMDDMKDDMMDDMKDDMMDDMKDDMMDDMKDDMMDDMKMDDDELMVTITDSVVNDGTQVNLEFNTIHVNYEISAKQNGEEIFKESAHAMEMTGASHMIDAVGSDENPIDVEIISLGIGPPNASQDWTGPTGTVATTQVVPEFGTIAMMVLAVAIISIIAVTAKSRVIPRF